MKYREQEFKYRTHLTREKFLLAVFKYYPAVEVVAAFGTDYFFTAHPDDTTFIRFRTGPKVHNSRELTIKVQDTGAIMDRYEVNLPLMPEASRQDVQAFLSSIGYEYRFPLTKSSIVVVIPGAVISYYIVSKDSQAFIEVELPAGLDLPPDTVLTKLEGFEAILGRDLEIGPSSRENRSLYQIYKEKLNAKRT